LPGCHQALSIGLPHATTPLATSHNVRLARIGRESAPSVPRLLRDAFDRMHAQGAATTPA
jgi:hypothetical protein